MLHSKKEEAPLCVSLEHSTLNIEGCYLELSVQTIISYTYLAQRAADLAYVRLLMLTARFKQCSVGSRETDARK